MKITVTVCVHFILCFYMASANGASPPNITPVENKIIKVLCIDGGGIRGIIPARILQEIEVRAGKPISQLFDLMVGNSTGGLIVLALNIPNQGASPKFTAKDILNFYIEKSPQIFYRSLWRKAYTGLGLWAAKYDRDAIDTVLLGLFGDIRLCESLKPVLITSYSIDKALPHFWSTEMLRAYPKRNFYMKDIAGATTAAPTYFAPKVVLDADGNKHYEADGGLYGNNPESIAAFEAMKLYPGIPRNNILIISLGTGKVKLKKPAEKLVNSGVVGWIVNANLIDVMMSAGSEWDDTEVSYLYPLTKRLQVNIDEGLSALDNTSRDNIEKLLDVAQEYIKQNTSVIDKICKELTN